MHTKDSPVVFAADSQPRFVAFASDDKEFVVVGNTLQRWRLSGKQALAEVDGSGKPFAFALSQDETFLAIGLRNSLEVRDARTLVIQASLEYPDPTTALSFSFDTSFLAARQDSRVRLYQLPDFDVLIDFECDDQLENDIQFLPDGRLAITSDEGVDLLDVPSGKRRQLDFTPADFQACEALQFQSGRLFCRRSYDISEFDIATAELVREFAIDRGVSTLLIARDKDLAFFGRLGGEIDLIDLASGVRVGRLRGHSKWIRSFSLSTDRQWLLSVGDEDDVRLWDVSRALSDSTAYELTGNEIASREYSYVTALRFESDNTQLHSATFGGVTAWHIPDLDAISSGSNTAKFTHFLSDTVAFGISDEFANEDDESDKRIVHAMLIDPASGQSRDIIEVEYTRHVGRIAVNQAHSRFAITPGHNFIHLMSFPSGKLIHRIHAHDDIDGVNTRINGLIFGPDESSLLSSSGDNTLKEWCIDSGEFIRRFDGQGESIEGIALSPDRTLLGICESHAILVFDSRTWEILLSIPYSRHIHWPTLAFSPNNRMLAFVTTHENDVKLYSTRSGELLDSLFGHTSGITRICFSPNGEYLATASDDDTLKLWKVPV